MTFKCCPMKFTAFLPLVGAEREGKLEAHQIDGFHCEPKCAWFDKETELCAILLMATKPPMLKNIKK